MKIRIWGCRGSLPTPGLDTARYGGNTTCVEVRLNDGTLIVIDAGSGVRNLGKALFQEPDLTEFHLLLTHAHWDHLIGFPFFAPAYLSRFKIHVRGGPLAQRSLRTYLEHQMNPPYFPVPFEALKAEFDFTAGNLTEHGIGSATLTPIRLSHPDGGYGFKFTEEGRSFVFLTDNELDFPHPGGLSRAEYVELCAGADLLLHDAQYTDQQYAFARGWGHTTFRSAVELGLQAKVKRLGLVHLDPDRTDQDMDTCVAACREQIQQTDGHLECFGAREGLELMV